MFGMFKLSPQKLRAQKLDEARFELEQYTLQYENLRSHIGMLRQRISRLEKSVEADKEFKAKCAARTPTYPPPPKQWKTGGVVSTDRQPQEKSDVQANPI